MSGVRLARMVGVLLALSMLSGVAAAETAEEATITVVHAVPGEGGFPADLYLNGQLVVSSMVLDAVSEPLAVPAGPVDVALFEAGANAADDAPILADQITVEPARSYTIVAQVVDENPAIALYVNDLAPVETGVTRLTIRNTGAAGPLQFAISGESVATDLTSPNEVTLEVPSGVHPLSVLSTSGSAILEQEVDFRAGSLMVLYAVGGVDGADFGLLTQQVVIPQATPTGVPTGTGGLRASQSNAVWLLVPLGFVAAAVLALRPRRTTG